MTDTKTATKRTGCPICRQAAAEAHAPFCSKRCTDIDLGRWLKGTYAIPTEEKAPIPANEDTEY